MVAVWAAVEEGSEMEAEAGWAAPGAAGKAAVVTVVVGWEAAG